MKYPENEDAKLELNRVVRELLCDQGYWSEFGEIRQEGRERGEA